jgi:hypothetical protein
MTMTTRAGTSLPIDAAVSYVGSLSAGEGAR